MPAGHTNEASGDASLHRLHAAYAGFRDKEGASLLQNFRDNMCEIYENILALDTAEAIQVPEDNFSALNKVVEIAGEQTIVELNAGT